jgi:glycosyltransferase involved in cell wall biosynthesis
MRDSKKINLLLDTSPLTNSNSNRGVGAYTRFLSGELGLSSKINLLSDKTLKPDIVHYPYFDLFFPTLPIKKRAKTVITIHDVIPLIFPKEYPPGKRGLLSFIRQKIALAKNADAIITDSKNSKQDIHNLLKINLDKIHVVYLAGNPDIKKANPELTTKIVKKYKLPEKYILYVGDINYNKNIPQLIKALKFLPNNIKLVCVGAAFREQPIIEWKIIEKQLALSDVEDRVIFINDLGINANNDLSAIYSKALIYAQPSLYEGFGLPVLEAMQSKTAVLCASNSSLAELFSNHAMIMGTQAEEIANTIKDYLSMSYDKKQSIIKKAYEYSQTFNWSKTTNQTIKVYQSLL